MLSVQTNVTSLVAQNNLRVDTDFQSRTIQRLTSGYRINSSGDDPAGLAVANGYRNSEAELTQGIQNANDGISTLQIIDGGMNNIGQILDRLKTLATQSASDTFTGNRDVLNSEFQGLVSEINRQAQAIGLDQNGIFAKSLSVYIGGGRAHGTTTTAVNSSLQFSLAGASVDAKTLGLTGMQALGGTEGVTDIGTASTTSVSAILNDANNGTTGSTDFYFSGPGFSGAEKVKVTVNTQNVTDIGTLVTAINQAIQNAGNNGTPASTAFNNANISAIVHTDSSGKKQLAFNSSSTGFQVQAGDLVSNALMGNFVDASVNADAKAMTSTLTGGENVTLGNTVTNPGNITVSFSGAGMASPVNITLQSTDTDVASAISDLQTQMASKLSGTGITLATPSDGNKLVFSNSRGEQFNVQVTGDTQDRLGFGRFQTGLNGALDYSTLTAGSAYDPTSAANAGTAKMQFSINGNATSLVSVDLASGPSATAASTSQSSGAANLSIDATHSVFSIAVDGTVHNIALTQGAATAASAATTAANAGADFGAAGVTTFNIHAATGTSVTGSVDLSSAFPDLSSNNAINVKVDGQAVQTLTLNSADTEATIAADINAKLVGAQASVVAHHLVITSNTLGAGGAIEISAPGSNSAAAALFGAGQLGAGKSVAGAAGNDQLLISVDGGAQQAITLTKGAAVAGSQLLTDINAILDPGGSNPVAQLDGNNKLIFVSGSTGVNSSIQILTPGSNSANTVLGLGAAVTAGAYHGADATDGVAVSTVASDIATALGAAATVTVGTDNAITITNASKGEGHTLEILSGNANSVLGFNAAAGTIVHGRNMSGSDLAAALQQQFNTTSDTDIQGAQLTASWTPGGGSAGKITVTSGNGTYFRVSGGGTGTSQSTLTALGTVTKADGGQADGTGSAFNLTGNNLLSFNVDGAGAKSVTLTSGTMTAKAIIDAINGAAAGVTASLVHTGSQDSIKITSNGNTGTSGSLAIAGSAATVLGLPASVSGASADIGFGSNNVSFAGALQGVGKEKVINAGGSSQTGDLGFTALAYGSDSQAVTVTANNSDGSTQYVTVNLANSGSTRNARTIDEAIETINAALQGSNNATLQQITAVKDNSSGTEKINFVSSLASFQVSLGSTASGKGLSNSTGDQGVTVNSSGISGGTAVDISTQQGGTSAISAITSAVASLGAAQANVGKAQNTLNYAVGLAESQMSNLAAAESRIRDADMASEAANLTKAQVLQQSAIAAMVQANSAPQAVLTLLRG